MFEKTKAFYDSLTLDELTEHLKSIGIKFVEKGGSMKLIQGKYKVIALEDLQLSDSPQTWTKGLDYEATIREDGTMQLASNEGISYYTAEGIENILKSEMFEFKPLFMNTGLYDKNGNPIEIGDRTRLVLDDGEVREFDVCFKTVQRTVKCHPDFDAEFTTVNITGVVFCWEGYDLFPCVDENGISDVSKMEVIEQEEI